MSARKAEGAGAFAELTIKARETQLALSPDAIVIRKNGIEFLSPRPFPTWAEMTLTLQSPSAEAPVACNGVVVSCTGNRHTGYQVALVFTGLSPQAEARLEALAYSTLA